MQRLPRPHRPRAVPFTAAAAVLAFGLLLSGLGAWEEALLAGALYAVPLATQLAHRDLVRAYGLWFGFLLIAQAALTPLVLDHDFKTLPPYLDDAMVVQGDELRGISGLQRVTTDAKGFRATPAVDYGAKRGLRVFAIGASTTEQIYLGDEHTWTYLLQEDLKSRTGGTVEVINTGLSGLRAVHHLATLKAILRYQPDLVLFLIGANDWNHQARRRFDPPGLQDQPVLGLSFEDTLLWVGLSTAFHRGRGLLNAYAGAEARTRIERGAYYARQRGSLAKPTRHEFAPDTVSDDYAARLAEISELCQKAGVICAFATQPTGYRPEASEDYKASFWMTPSNRDYTLSFRSMIALAHTYNRFLAGFAAARGHPLCDIAPHLPPGFEAFYDDMHVNLRGARRVAELLAECLAPLL